MRSIRLAAAALAASASLAAVPASAAIPIQFDGSFDTGLTTSPGDPNYKTGTTFTTNDCSGTSGGQCSILSNGAAFTTGGSIWGFSSDPAAGGGMAVLQGNTTSFSTKVFGLIFGAVYKLTFDAVGRSNYGTDAITVTAGGHTDGVGASTTTYGPSTGDNLTTITKDWSGFNLSFKFTGNNLITFAGLTPQGANASGNTSQDYATAVDNLRLVLIAAPTPEPAAYLSMLLGFGLVGGIAYRRRKSLFGPGKLLPGV